MKKIISIFAILAILSLLIFTGNTYAASLDAINVQTDKTTVRPGTEVKVTVNFGTTLGAYTFDVSYDNDIFEYVSAEGGTANDTTDKVRVVFHDDQGGTNARSNMSVIFKAKEDITTSNPTEFTVIGEGLANADASVTYDDITTPIVKNVTVEPEYVDYTLKLEHTGDIIKGQEKAMTLSYTSPMGRYYEHARLIAEATAPTGANVRLLATDTSRLEHDIIDSGWGDAQGYKIGGKDVSQVLNVRGIFSEVGDYTITLKLIDRDNSDTVIAQQTFNFKAIETPTQTTPPTTTPGETVNPGQQPGETVTPEQTPEQQPTEEAKPTEIPKAGNNVYVPIVVVMVALVGSYIFINKRK